MISGVSGMTWIVFLSLSQASVYKRYEKKKKIRKIILELKDFLLLLCATHLSSIQSRNKIIKVA